MSLELGAILGTAFLAVVGILLFLSRRDLREKTIKEVEAEASQQALEDVQKTMDAQRKVREKYEKLRADTPDDWDALRLRGEDQLPPDSESQAVMRP